MGLFNLKSKETKTSTKATTSKTTDSKTTSAKTASKPAATKTSTTTKATAIKSTAKTTDTKTAAKSTDTKAKSKSKIYHVSKRKDDGKWTIKLEGSDKVIKTFATKVEAEEYVDGLAERQDGSVKLRASKGKNAGKFVKR